MHFPWKTQPAKKHLKPLSPVKILLVTGSLSSLLHFFSLAIIPKNKSQETIGPPKKNDKTKA
jgi:hypothetical protein